MNWEALVQDDRWARLEQVFAQALELPDADRRAYLARACGDDAALRDEIEALLRAHAAPGVLDIVVHGAESAVLQPSLAAGTLLGPWRIGVLIGRGGMGEVYSAHRADGSFEQRVAIKLLRYEAVGELARFHAERRILASLEHAGIARLLDGGTTPDGRPYTVMEYVHGQSLTDYCRARGSSLAERLALFLQVCDAVAFAHRNLVVHRDLKPANILVDADGKVKLLDFGIAKLLDATASPGAADVTVAPFTPDYAAPEQLSGRPATTATDIYALGVLLFELLTGERPLQMRSLPSTQALRLLLDREPPPASRTAQGAAESPIPARLLAGDLDAIVAKCLRKEPAHRYDSVDGLRLDVERHGRHEPVIAREGAQLYVLGRLVRRYRWVAAGIAVLVGTLAAGLAGTIWQARRAESQARTAAAVQGFVTDLFRANSSDQDDPVKARATTARELLDVGASKIAVSMIDAPEAKLSVMKLLSGLYDDLALADEAVRLRRQALVLARTIHGPDSTEVATALLELAGSMQASMAVDERGAILAEAVAILDRKRDSGSVTRGQLLVKLAEHYDSVDTPRALEHARQAVRLFEARPPSGDLAESLSWQGVLELDTGLLREAAVSFRRAVEVSRSVHGDPNPDLPRFYADLADVQYRLQNMQEAEENARRALQTAIAINGKLHADAVHTEIRLGRILFDTGRTQEARGHFLSAKQHALQAFGGDDPMHTPQALLENGYSQMRMGLLQAGLADVQAAIDNHRRNRPGTVFLGVMLEIAASALTDLGRTKQAQAYLDEATSLKLKGGLAPRTARFNLNTGTRIRLALDAGEVKSARALLDELYVEPDETTRISTTALERDLLTAEVDLATGRHSAAAGLAVNVRRKIQASGLGAYLKSYEMRADLIEGQATLRDGHPAKALPLLQRALATRQMLLAPSSPKLAEAQIALAECHLALGQVGQAGSLLRAATTIHGMHGELSARYREPLRQLQGRQAATAAR